MSSLVSVVSSMFDLPLTEPTPPVATSIPDILLQPGRIVLITGPSGSGKSQLLRAMKTRHGSGVSWIEPSSIRFGERSVIDTVCGQLDPACPENAIERGLALLSRVGLAEAWTYLRTPAELSDGQRWRLVLAMMFANTTGNNRTAIIAMDEFAALLDRVTAMIVARALRKLITDESGLSAIVVTSHDDLTDALCPDTVVDCDFGEYRITHA